ncbi:NAD(P)-dependent alcohol dehydrogenase [Rubinisphaera margarita]|uniref:NAD(P)-dependent alcohol dehydrogenase n=1 Tax=Rubinisphaera margarita TaxID=2909586 RepID=UPI001EE93209|nr:NAD(P)-dependent alcohol dehydrogenase [Rubinisphaera margarita]MCG6155927.1 NAD(P)-dependent alcohol dehydrogenase [Rubinisphaera margarita]
MRAVVYKDYGGPEVLELVERERPQPARDEVLIRVAAAGINPVDARLRSGEMKWLLPGGFPRIPGYDVAGVIEQVGSQANFQVGQRVLAFLDHVYGGGYAEYAVCTHSSVVEIPDSMTFDEAAALPLAGSTALQSLREYGHLKSGMTVLVNGASGGVGSLAVQIAVADGAVVTGVASSDHEDFVRSLGAAEFIDYRRHEFTSLKQSWDLVFDAAGKSSFKASRPVLAKDGTYVSTEPSLRGLVVSLTTLPLEKQGRVMLARSRKEDLSELVRLSVEGHLKIHVADSIPLSQASDAHAKIEKGGFCGKIVLNVSQ